MASLQHPADRTHLMQSAGLRVLLVEDNPRDAAALRCSLIDSPAPRFDITVAQDLGEARDALREGRWDAVLLDLSLPDSWGLAGLRELVQVAPRVPILVLAYLDEEVLAMQALRLGAQDYLVKGAAEPEDLRRAIRHAIGRKGFAGLESG